MNEYLAYMTVLAERIDRKKLTEVEAEYELVRKESELAERVAAMRAQSTAQADAAKAKEDAAARLAIEQATARKATEEAAALREMQVQRQNADQLESARQQAAIAAALQAQADEQRRANATAIFI
jgi:colicin import membrane protein